MGAEVEEQQEEQVPVEEPVLDEAPEQESEAPSNEGGEGHPAWQPILDAVPTPFHEALKPQLQDWDRGVQERFTKLNEKYDPWKTFVDEGIRPDDATRGLRLLQNISSDPKVFYQRLGEQLRAAGLLEEQAPSQQQVSDEEQEEDEQGQLKDPRFDQFMSQLEEARQQMAQQQAEREAEAQVDRELAALEAKHGKPLGDELRSEVLMRAAILHDRATANGTQPPTLEQAYDGLMSLVKTVRGPAKSAPKVLPSSGGVPARSQGGPTAKELANNAQLRKQAGVDLLRRLNESS